MKMRRIFLELSGMRLGSLIPALISHFRMCHKQEFVEQIHGTTPPPTGEGIVLQERTIESASKMFEE
jgi:hypothetical protein